MSEQFPQRPLLVRQCCGWWRRRDRRCCFRRYRARRSGDLDRVDLLPYSLDGFFRRSGPRHRRPCAQASDDLLCVDRIDSGRWGSRRRSRIGQGLHAHGAGGRALRDVELLLPAARVRVSPGAELFGGFSPVFVREGGNDERASRGLGVFAVGGCRERGSRTSKGKQSRIDPVSAAPGTDLKKAVQLTCVRRLRQTRRLLRPPRRAVSPVSASMPHPAQRCLPQRHYRFRPRGPMQTETASVPAWRCRMRAGTLRRRGGGEERCRCRCRSARRSAEVAPGS